MQKRGFVGSVANNKGGTGKTVSTVNLSAGLSLEGKKVLVIDNDPQSDSTKALMKKNVKIENSLYDLLASEEGVSVESCIYPTIHKNLYILPNITETTGLEIPLSVKFPESNWVLRDAVYEYASKEFDFTLIDCPPTLSIFVANALYASDFLIVPVTAGSGNSLDGVAAILGFMEEIKVSGNTSLQFLKILINNIDGRKKSTHQGNMETLRNDYGEENIFKQHIPTSSAFEAAESLRNNTIFTYARTSQGALAFRAVAIEMIDFLDATREG